MATNKNKSVKKNSAFAPFLPYGKTIKELIGEGQLVEVYSQSDFVIAFTKELLENLDEGAKRFHIDDLVSTWRNSSGLNTLSSDYRDSWGRRLHVESAQIRSWNQTLYILGYRGNFHTVDMAREMPKIDRQTADRVMKILSQLGVA